MRSNATARLSRSAIPRRWSRFPQFARTLRSAHRTLRQARMVARGLTFHRHPILAQIVPIRRCNLSCTYCNEFDAHSQPVPTGDMLARIDRLAALGTTIIDLSGGEPLLHPELDEIHQADPHARPFGRSAHERVSTERGADHATQSRRLGSPPDQHRQRQPRRHLEEELATARPKAAVAGQACAVLGQHQLRVGRQLAASSGRADDRAPGDRARLHGHGRLDPRDGWSADPAHAGAATGVRGDPATDRAVLFSGEPEHVPAQPREGRAERLALPRGVTVPLHLRGWPRALVLAAAGATPASRWPSTARSISSESSIPTSLARRCAPSHASIASPCWTVCENSHWKRLPSCSPATKNPPGARRRA